MQTSLLQSVLVVALVGGCGATGRFSYTGEPAPDLVVISPGVQVIADLDTPIFYSENYYWRSAGGFWYRSRSHRDGWARVSAVPVEIRAIDRPSAYVHYHGSAHVSGDRQTHAPATEPRDQREVVVPASHRDDRHDNKDHDKKDKNDKNDKNDRHDNKDDKHRDKTDGDDKRE